VNRDNLEMGLAAAGRLRYVVTRSGLLDGRAAADVVLSRAVLEHVDNLPATFQDICDILGRDGISVHQVDLKSHGLHKRHKLDFLVWSEGLWRAMFSHKGAPNRLRVDSYRSAARQAGLTISSLVPSEIAQSTEVDEIRPHLAEPFRRLDDQDLAVLSFWMTLTRPDQSRSRERAA
jgi:hypothetical protein